MTKLADQNDPYVQRTNEYGPYGYIPLLAPAGLFVAVYALLFVGHTFRTWKSRAWWTSMIAIGCILETAGNALRLYGHFNATTNINAYIAMQVIVVCTPVFFAATHFTILSKVLLATGIQIGPLPNRMVLPFFVFLDVASLAVQGAGSAIAAINEQDGKDANGGGNIVIAGLAVQLFGYLCFDVLSILFAKRSWSNLTHHAKAVLASSFISALLVLLRSSFRIGEMARGWVGPVSTTEWYYYAFDCAPVSLAVLLLLIFYPADILSDKSASNRDVDEARGSQSATDFGSSKLLLQSRQDSDSSGGIVKSHKSEASSFA